MHRNVNIASIDDSKIKKWGGEYILQNEFLAVMQVEYSNFQDLTGQYVKARIYTT